VDDVLSLSSLLIGDKYLLKALTLEGDFTKFRKFQKIGTPLGEPQFFYSSLSFDRREKQSGSQRQNMMTREDLNRKYAVNKKGVITSSGHFAGQMVYVPYFWDKYVKGLADDTTGGFITFYINEGERKEFPELGEAAAITLVEIGRTLVCELPKEPKEATVGRSRNKIRVPA
jgi:hypothetical protein